MADMAVEPQMGLTFEQVWAALMETRASMKETDRRMKETDRLIRELREDGKETDRRMKETDRQMKETDRRMKELQKSMGYLNNRFGEMAEHLVAPNIVKKFNELGYHFNDVAQERKFYNVETGEVGAEFDVILENGEFSIGVEVKTKPSERDVSEHIERIEFLRRLKDKQGDKREVRGAIAGAIMSRKVREAALREGLYVIEQSGDTVRIEEPENVRGWRANDRRNLTAMGGEAPAGKAGED
jgi:hypothetical protein